VAARRSTPLEAVAAEAEEVGEGEGAGVEEEVDAQRPESVKDRRRRAAPAARPAATRERR
jgi:hypothetical protein